MTVLALIATVFKAIIVKGTLRFTRLALKTMHFSKVSFVKMLLIRVEPLTLHRISSVAMCSALCRTFYKQIMLQEKAGELAGKVWEVLHTEGELSGKDLKKAVKAKSEKDLYLALGWLLREDKLIVAEAEKDILVSLK